MSTIADMLQGGGGGISLQGSSPHLQASSGSGLVVQPASPRSTIYLQPAAGGDVLNNPNTHITVPSSSSSGSGGGGGGSTPQPAPDPWASTPWGSQAAYNSAVADYNSLKGSTFNSITDAITQGGQGFNSALLDYIDSRKIQQNKVNADKVQNELSREQGMQGILDMVGNGIRSGGVILANDNAGSSSAGEALARAYGVLGRQEASKVGNQFAQGENNINTEQGNIVLADTTEKRHAEENKTNIINQIVNSARSQLAALNQDAQYASLPDRVNIENKIAEIKQNALDALAKFDGVLSGGISGQAPISAADTRSKAQALLTAGTAPENSFNYTTDIPAELQGSGQFASSLPIFVAPSSRKNNT